MNLTIIVNHSRSMSILGHKKLRYVKLVQEQCIRFVRKTNRVKFFHFTHNR